MGNFFHKIIDGVHHLLIVGRHDVEQVKVVIDGRPGLKADIDKLMGPIKDAVVAEVTTRFNALKASSPDQAVTLLKPDVPAIVSTVKSTFAEEAHHAGNVDTMISLVMQGALAIVDAGAALSE
jgi:hypothetical protein